MFPRHRGLFSSLVYSRSHPRRCSFKYYRTLEQHIRDELKKQLNELDRILAKYERDRARMIDRLNIRLCLSRETVQVNDWIRRRKEADAQHDQVTESKT